MLFACVTTTFAKIVSGPTLNALKPDDNVTLDDIVLLFKRYPPEADTTTEVPHDDPSQVYVA